MSDFCTCTNYACNAAEIRFSFAVALFYLPNWQCVLLDYYDAAKSATQEPPAAPDFL